jgi:stearoyl-CoA desaturase (delta-9 desaturase)
MAPHPIVDSISSTLAAVIQQHDKQHDKLEFVVPSLANDKCAAGQQAMVEDEVSSTSTEDETTSDGGNDSDEAALDEASLAEIKKRAREALLLSEKQILRNKMLLGWGSSISIAFIAGTHILADKWFGVETWGHVSGIYLAVFLACFGFATYVDNQEALKPRSAPSSEAKEVNFFQDATPQHYSWLLSVAVAVLYPCLKLSGLLETSDRIIPALVWIAPSLIMKLAIGMSAILHRFVSHRAYEPRNRAVQFAICWLGCLAGQGSPLFWGAMHNRHHKHCDTKLDPHSPQVYPFWYAWWGWTITESANSEEKYIKKLWGYTEIQWLHRFFYVPFLVEYAACWYFFGFAVMLYGCWLPSTLSAAFTLLFNVRSHQPSLDELPHTTCKAFNLVDLGAWVVGEAAHLDHHRDPKAYNRVTDQWFGFYDFPFYLFIKPMLVCGLVTLPNNEKDLGDKERDDGVVIMLTTWAFVGFVAYICASIV